LIANDCPQVWFQRTNQLRPVLNGHIGYGRVVELGEQGACKALGIVGVILA